MTTDGFAEASTQIETLIENIERVIIGKHETVSLVVSALLSRGHVLLEDTPGVGKTMLARALACSIECDFHRIQCTPDLLPIDITGYVDPRTAELKRGPVFANIVLADELNRATPRTQSALLEAMGEGQVSIEGQTHILPQPFMVIATQNPIEHRGVNDLPEAQMDRFQMLLSPGYPTEAEEEKILTDRFDSDPIWALQPVIDAAGVASLMQVVTSVRVAQKLIRYILRLVRQTRVSDELVMGASPRSALQLMHLAKAYALIKGRSYVIPDDVKELAAKTLPHRVIPKIASDGSVSATVWKSRIINDIIAEVPTPDL